MTYSGITECLRDAGIEYAETEAALLIEHFFGVSRAQLLAFPDRRYESDAFFAALDRRCAHYPLQYIFGKWDFFKETYFVNESCLIPRADTELLVEQAIRLLPPKARFADLCTGSGCIAISTLRHRADCTALGLDLFEETLATAAHNAEENGVTDRLSLRLADVLKENALKDEPPFDAILSNPPYIRSAMVDTLEEELFSEPRAALDGGADGLDFYRAILSYHGKHLKKGGFMLLEIGFDQSEELRELAAHYGYDCLISNDLSGNPRCALLTQNDT